jgi:hypothetical protein
MNIRLTILLAVLAAMIGSTWAIIEFTDLVSRGEPKQQEPWLFHIEESDIAHIEVMYKDEAIEFAREPGSYLWQIVGDPSYPVFQDRWAGTTLLLSGPRVNRGLKQTIEDPAQYGLDPPESIVRVTDIAGNSFEFHMGNPTPDGRNQYVRLVGDEALYTVPSIWADVVNRLAYDPPWGRLYRVEIEQVTVIEVSAGDHTAVYYLGNTGWVVHRGPPPTDPEYAAPVSEEWAEWLETLTSPLVDTIVDQRLPDRDTERLEEYGFASPDVRVVIARRGQATLEFQLAEGPPGDDSYYARTVDNVDESLYSISKSRLQGIEDLATDPLVLPGWEPPVAVFESEDSSDN